MEGRGDQVEISRGGRCLRMSADVALGEDLLLDMVDEKENMKIMSPPRRDEMLGDSIQENTKCRQYLEQLGLIESDGTVCKKAEKATILVQKIFRNKMYKKYKVDRFNLVERINLENDVFYGAMRLLNVIVLFVFMILTLLYSDNPNTKNGIWHNLDSEFNFKSIESVQNKEQLWDALKDVSESSYKFFTRSQSMYKSKFTPLEIHQTLKEFDSTERYNILTEFPTDVGEFTLTTWISMVDQHVEGGNIFRKSMPTRDSQSSVLCWQWSVGQKGEQHFRYGEHTFYDTDTKSVDKRYETQSFPHHDIHLPGLPFNDLKKLQLLTVVVTKNNVTFYTNKDAQGTVSLPIPVADCQSSDYYVSHEKMKLGRLHFYPEALSPNSIAEIFEFGGTLLDVSTGSPVSPVRGTRVMNVEETQTTLTLNDIYDSGRLVTVVQNAIGSKSTKVTLEAVLNTSDVARAVLNAVHGEYPPAAGYLLDNLTGLEYLPLIKDPVTLSDPATDADTPRYWNREQGFPPVSDAFSLSFWYKHVSATPYIFVANPFKDARATVNNGEVPMCWGLWHWFDGYGIILELGPRPEDRQKISERSLLSAEYIFTEDDFRHCTWTFKTLNTNPPTTELIIYVDGTVLGKEIIDTDVNRFDCSGVNASSAVTANRQEAVVALGHTYPRNTYHGEAGLADVRLYHHVLDPKQVLELAKDESVVERVCAMADDLFNTMGWTDAFGNDCDWYYRMEAQGVCDEPAFKYCPMSCSRKLCLAPEVPKSYFIWDRIKSVSPRLPDGAVCLSQNYKPEQVVADCEAVRAGSPPSSDSYFDYIAGIGVRANRNNLYINLTDCEALKAHIDQDCGFDAEAVKNFTKAVNDGGGSYSIYFWVKSSGFESLDKWGNFWPVFIFLSSASPPTISLSSYVYPNTGDEDYYMVDFHSACDGISKPKNMNIYEFGKFSNEDWTLIVLSYTNGTDPSKSSIYAGLNERQFVIPGLSASKTYTQCMHDPEMFFSAIEFNTPMLISPIGMVPHALSKAEQANIYMTTRNVMNNARAGPRRSEESVADLNFEVIKEKYRYTTSAVTTPIIVQIRDAQADTCDFEFSKDFITAEHQIAVADNCQLPRACTGEVFNDEKTYLSCRGDLSTEEFFGLKSVRFQGEDGYADFLFALTGNGFLSRGGKVLDTTTFIDSESKTVRVVYVFYSVQLGCTSVMQVEVDMSQVKETVVSVLLNHLLVVSGDDLRTYIILQVVNLMNAGLMGIACSNVILQLMARAKKRALRRGEKVSLYSYWELLDCVTIGDIMISAFTIIFIVIRLKDAISSADHNAALINNLQGIPWGDTAVTPSEKTSLFLDNVTEIMNTIAYEGYMSKCVMILLVVLGVRMLLATSCHPRLALLTGTITESMDDMWHTFILVIITFSFFAGFGTVAFGSYRNDYSNFGTAMQTQFGMMFGAFPDDWGHSAMMIAYTISFMVVIVLLILNFILATIVEAYMKVRIDIEKNEVEMEFFGDVFRSILTKFVGIKDHWPSKEKLMVAFARYPNKKPVDLQELDESKLFRTPDACAQFLKYWRNRYDCLSVKPLEAPEYFPQVEEIEKRMAWLFTKPPLTETERLRLSGRNWKANPPAEPLFRPSESVMTASGIYKNLAAPQPTVVTVSESDLKNCMDEVKGLKDEMKDLKEIIMDALKIQQTLPEKMLEDREMEGQENKKH